MWTNSADMYQMSNCYILFVINCYILFVINCYILLVINCYILFVIFYINKYNLYTTPTDFSPSWNLTSSSYRRIRKPFIDSFVDIHPFIIIVRHFKYFIGWAAQGGNIFHHRFTKYFSDEVSTLVMKIML